MVWVKAHGREEETRQVGAEVIPEIMDYREEIAGVGDVEAESIAVGSKGEYESKVIDSLFDKESSPIVGELEEKGRLRLNESGNLGVSLLKHDEVEVFEKPGFTNADRLNGGFLEQELPNKVREQSDENQTVDETDRTRENKQGTFTELSEMTSCLEEERNTESIESCPPIPELHHHLPNETGELSVEDGKITEIPVPDVFPGKEIETEAVNENAPVGMIEPNIEHETVIGEKDDSTDAEEPEIITYRGRDLVEEGYRGNLPEVGLENENVLQSEELKGKGQSVFVEESGGVEGDGLEKVIPRDGQFTENYTIAEKKGQEIGIFSSNEDARKPVTEGRDEADGQIEGTVEPQVSEASVPEEKVDVEVPNEEVTPDIPNVKDDSVDGLPSAEVSAPREKIPDEDEIPKTNNDDADEIDFGDHKEGDVKEDDVIGNDGLSKDRELTTIETVTAETDLPSPGTPSNRDSASHPGNDFAEGGKNEGSEADSIGITREITDQVAIELDDASPDSNVFTEAMDGDPGNDPFSVPEVTRDEFQPDVAEKEAQSSPTASNEFDIAGEEDTSSVLTLSGDHTKKEYEEVSLRGSSGKVDQEKAAEVSTEQADTVSGKDNDSEAHSVKDNDTGTRKENETLESTERDEETDDASDPIETEVPIVADSLGDFVQQETRVILPEQESLTETPARSLENFAEERNVSEALSTLEGQTLDVPGASSEVKHESEESNISEEVHLHAGLSALTDAANEISETRTANIPEALAEEKLDVDQRSAKLDTEISSVVSVDSNIDSQSASNEASNYEEASAAEAVVTESKIPDEKILKKSFEQLKQDADEIDEDGKPTVMEGESERELDEVLDREIVLEDSNMSAGNVLNDMFEKSETDMNTEQPHDMADQGIITLIEVPREQIEEAPVDIRIPSIDLKDSHSDEQLAFNEEPKYEESSGAEMVTNSKILEEKILARSFDGESEAQIGQDADEAEKYEETAQGKENSAGKHDEVLSREKVPSVLDETTADGMQQLDIANQIDIALTEATVETTKKAAVYDSATDAFTDDQRDVSYFGTLTQVQELETNQKQDEPTSDDATSTLQDGTKLDTQTEETPNITLSETTDEVASKIREDDSFGVAGEVSENLIDGQSASNEGEYESKVIDSLFDKESSPIVGELEEKGRLRLNESGNLGVSLLKHDEVEVFEKPGFTNADRLNGGFLEQELPNKVREQSDENQTVDETDRTRENKQGTFTELSEMTSCLEEERNTESIEVESLHNEHLESCPPIPELHHHLPNETGELSVEDGKITEIPVPDVFPGKEIETEAVNENAPVGMIEPNIEHETVIGEKDDSTDAEEPEIITYRGRDLVEEGYRGNLPEVGLENENVLQSEELKGKGQSVFVEESGGVEGDGLEKVIPRDGQFTENYTIAEKKGQEIGIFSSNEDARKPVTEGRDEADGQIEGTVEPQVSEASVPEEKVDVEVPNEEVTPDIPNVKDDSVDGLPSAEVSAPREKIPDEDEIPKTNNDDADEIDFGDHKEGDVKEDDVIGNDGLSKDRELTTIETVTAETDLPSPGTPSNRDSASHPGNDFAEGGKNEGSEADSIGITREITDQVAIELDDASPDSNVFTEAMDGDPGNDPFSVPEVTRDEFQPDVAEKEAQSSPTASNEFDIAGEEDTSSVLTLSGDHTKKEYEEVSLRGSSGKVDQEKAAEVSTEQADTVSGKDNDSEAHSVKDNDTGTRKENETLESTERDEETDDASDPIETEVPIVADSLGDFVQQETRVILPEQESLTETPARSLENFAEERNVSEALSTLEGQTLDVPGASSEVKHESEESNISEEVHLHAGLSALTDAANEISETRTANIPEALAEEKLDVDQRSAKLDTEISSVVSVDSNIDSQSASNEASNYEEASAAEAVVTESKIPDEKILKKSFEQLKQDADEIDEDGKPTVMEGESERELDEVLDREIVLEDSNMSAGNVLNDMFEKSETDMNTEQPHDMADQGIITLIEVPREQIEEAPVDIRIPSIDLKDSHSDEQLAFNEEPKYEESSGAEMVTNSKILEEKILARSFDGESEAQIGQDADEAEKYEETAQGKENSAGKHDEVLSREKVPSVLDETTADGMQQLDIANQIDIALTEATVETTKKAAVYDSATDAFTDDQRDVSYFGTLTQVQELETNQKQDEPTSDDATSTLQDGTKLDTQTEETPNITLSETTDEVASKIREDDSFGVAGEVSENLIDGQSASNEDADEAVKYEETAPSEENTAREHDEVPAREEVPSVLDETVVDGVQQQDITDQTDIELIEATVETTEKATVYNSATDAFTDDQRGVSYFGTLTQDQELETNKKQDEPTSDDAASTLQYVTKIDTATEETPDITLSETTDEVASKIQEDDSFVVADEVSENPIDGQSASNEAQIGQDADEAEKYGETAPGESNSAREHDEVPAREEVPSVLDETVVDGLQQQDITDQTDIALTEATVETTEKAAVYDSATNAFTDDQRGVSYFETLTQDQELKTNQKHDEPTSDDAASTLQYVTKIDTATEETPDITLSETTDEVASKIQEDDSFVVVGEVSENPIDRQSASNEAQIGQDADEAVKYGETAPSEENTAREHDEVPAREEVPSVLDETVVDGLQQQDITDQTDIALTEAIVETTGKAAVYDSATDAFTDDQRGVSYFGTLTQDQELKTNQKHDEPTSDDVASTLQYVTKIDTATEETPDITLSGTTNEVASIIQEDDSFWVASKVLENPIEESAISPDETIKSEKISGERQDMEEPALGQGDEGSSLVDDNINENERGTVGSSEFMDAADSIKEIKEEGLQMESVNEPLTGTGITEDKDPTDIVEKDLIDGTESDEKIDAGEVASETKDISSREVEQYEQHVGELASHLQVGFSETPESEPSFDHTVVVDQTEEERKEIYDSNDRDGEIADPDIHQSSVNEASDEQTEEEKAAVVVDSNIVSGTETGITDTEPSQVSRDVDTESFKERNSATENTENKESFYEKGKYNIESDDRSEEVTRSEKLVDAKETSEEAVFSHSELVELAVAEEGILDQGLGMENSYERDSSLIPPEENEVKDQEVPSGAATESFSEKKEQDKEAKEPYEEISYPEQRYLVDITYDKGTASPIPADTQELFTLEGDIQKDEACIKNKMEASENEGIRGLPHEDDQQDAQGEEVALEGEITSKAAETDRIIQEDEKGNKEAENNREANEDEINKDGESDMGSSTIDEESLANATPATETADLENKDSYTTADYSHVEVIEGEKRDLTLSNEIAEEGDSYTAGADTPFSERSISDNQPGMSSENLDGENARELTAAAESVEDVAGKEEAPIDSEGQFEEATGQTELVIATEVSNEVALSETQNETAMTLQTQPRDHSYEQVCVESAPAEGLTIEFNGENEQDRQDRTSDEQSSRVEIDNPDLGTDTPTRDVPLTFENVEIDLAESNKQTARSNDVGEQKISEEAFFQADRVDNSLPPEAEVEGIESNEVLQNEAKTTEGGSAKEAPQLTHYTEISSDGPSDEMSAFSTSVPDDVQEREIREIVASEDDQTSRTIQEVSEHTNVDGVASAENDDSKEESFVVENQITSEQILESTDQQIEPIPSGEAVQEKFEVVESAPIGKSTLDEYPLLRVSEKESESEGVQSRVTNEAWFDGKEPTLHTDIRQYESDTILPKYADKERDVTETEGITPLELGDRGFASAVHTKTILTEEEASKIKEVVSEDAGESIGDAIREVIPVTSDTQPSMSSEYLDSENAGELNPTTVSVEDGAGEEEGADAGIEEASKALVGSKGREEEATGQSELINAMEVSAESALSDVPEEATATIQTVPADDLYERDFVELTEESKVHVESATADGSTIEYCGNTEHDIEDKTCNEQTSQVEINNRDLAAYMPPRDILATAENVEIDRAAFDERTTRSSDICEQKSALVEEVERDQNRELSTLEESFIQTDREDISLPPEVELGGSESNEVLQKEAENKEGGSVEEAPQFAHSMELSSDGPSDQIPALSTSVPDNVQEIRTPEIVMSEDDQTNRTILKELDDDSGNKVEQEDNAENEEKEIGIVHTSNEERPANGVFVEETIASDQLTQEQESSNSRSGENIGEVIKDVYTDGGGVAASGIVKPTEPTEITGNLENKSIGETDKTVMPDETNDSKKESFVEPIPHEEAVITETEDVEPVSVGESTLDQSPLADVSPEVSTLLHTRTEAWSDGNEPTLQTDVCQDESDTSMSKFADKETDVQESEKITPLELGNRDFISAVQTKVALTEQDTSKTKEVVSEGEGGSVDEAIREVIPVTSDTQSSLSGEYLDSENGGELNSAAVSVEDVAGKEEGTDAGIEETSEALITSKGHEVEDTGQRCLINTMEVSDKAALSDASNETAATIETVPTTNGSTIEFNGENEQEVQDKTFNEQASQVEIDNQDLAAYMPTRDVPATVENVEIDRAELDEQTDGIGRSLPPEAETGGKESNQVLQNESETKEKISGVEALQSTEISSDGPSDQMSAFSTSIPDAVQEREICEIVASEDEQTNGTIQEDLDDNRGNKVEQGDNAEKAEQEFTLNEERLASGESFEETISSDQLSQSTEQQSNGSLGGENASEAIKYVYTDIGGVPSADAEADITKTTQPTQSTVNLEEESIGETSTAVIPDENFDSKEQSFIEPFPREEAVLAETEDVEQASVGEGTLEQNPLADESTLPHARTEAWPDGNEPTLETDVRQDESDTSMPKYAEKERDVPATGKIAPPELGDRDFSSSVPTKDILTEEDASKVEEVESVDVAADDTKEQPSVTTEDTILKNKEVRDDTGHAAEKPEDTIEIYGDKTSAAASVVDAETTIPRGNGETAEVGESVDNAIGEVIPMTSDSSSPVPKEEEMLVTETEHEKENALLEISQRNLTDTSDLKYVNINEMAADIPSTDRQAATGSVSYLPQGSIDAITAASVDQESASLTLPSEETVVDKAWTSRESPEAEHFNVGFKETGTRDDTAEKYEERRSLDFTSAKAEQETKNEINGGEILSDGDAADKADYGLASEAVEIADKIDPSLKEKEERAFDEAQMLQEMSSQKQDEYKQGAADEDKAPILSDANDPVEGTVNRASLEEAEGQTFDSVEGMCTDRKMESPVSNVQDSSEEIFEGDRTHAIEESKGLNQVIASKKNTLTAHDSGLPRDSSLAKEVTANLSGSTEQGLPPAEARELRDQSKVNLDGKEFEGEKLSANATTVLQKPVADNLQLTEQSTIIKPDENEEHEDDDHEHIEHSDAAPLMAKSSKDFVDGKARQKKSHNHLLSGMSSKVKSSISKVKNVITGKSSNHNKEHSPKHGQ